MDFVQNGWKVGTVVVVGGKAGEEDVLADNKVRVDGNEVWLNGKKVESNSRVETSEQSKDRLVTVSVDKRDPKVIKIETKTVADVATGTIVGAVIGDL